MSRPEELTMKNLAKKAVLRSGLLRLAARLNGSGAAILMYHSVMEDPGRYGDLLGGIIHSTDVFRSQIELVAKEYRPVSLDQIKTFVRGEGAIPSRAVAITFDDGYADNCEIAAPILKQAGIPATFYVTVDCVERRKLPWPARLRFAFRNTKKESWIDAGERAWRLHDGDKREQAYLISCDECCKLAGDAQEKYLVRLETELDTCVPPESGSLMMSYDQVKELARQGHIVGSHTMTHPNMALIDLNDARGEMTDSKKRLEQQIGGPVVHFSYPCPALTPHWTEQTVGESFNAGYETAVTTDGGLARNGDNPLWLSRVRPARTVDGLRWNLECAFAGRRV